MSRFNYTTKTRKILADLYTPVGVYMRLRDIYPQSALMERVPTTMAQRTLVPSSAYIRWQASLWDTVS